MALATGSMRSGRWTADPGFGVYVHIPFCAHRCNYCDFNTYEGQESLIPDYVDALVADIGRWPADGRAATSVFFGGGTPTLLAPADLERILRTVAENIGLVADAEITVEANPETVDEPKLARLREAGFNRISVGVQSLAPHVLSALGRTHPAERALAAIRAAQSAGFEDVNADLIYGSPWESESDWLRTLEGVLEVQPQHISAYALTVEEGTPLATLVTTGRVPDVDPDVQAARHGIASELLAAAGYERYEISNWARPGHACRHNVLYWCAGDYLGFGAGAHAHLSGSRWWSTRLPRDFITRVREQGSVIDGREDLTADQRAGEAMMLGLRLDEGVDVDAFRKKFGAAAFEQRRSVIDDLAAAGLVTVTENRVRLADGATMLANEVLYRVL